VLVCECGGPVGLHGVLVAVLLGGGGWGSYEGELTAGNG
jgi:hypothetical protein